MNRDEVSGYIDPARASARDIGARLTGSGCGRMPFRIGLPGLDFECVRRKQFQVSRAKEPRRFDFLAAEFVAMAAPAAERSLQFRHCGSELRLVALTNCAIAPTR